MANNTAVVPCVPRKTPKDGPGPRGVPDCYYTSRVLNSTFRYARFVKKLHRDEDIQRAREAQNQSMLKQQMVNDFFLHCDRKSRINDVARRVDLCMRSYQEDLEAKRQKLISMYTLEEERDVRKFVEQVQAGAEAVWRDKQERLKYLLDKRQRERDEKYNEIPISKCVHAGPCLLRRRTKETQQIHLYQMREKEARKMAEKELDNMWHEVAMRESDALAARMEKAALDRYKRDRECVAHSDRMLEQKRRQQQIDRENTRAEQLAMKKKFDEDTRKEEEAEQRLKQKRLDAVRESNVVMEETRQRRAKAKADQKLLDETWDSLARGSMAGDSASIQRRKQIEIETTHCNAKLVALKDNMKKCDEADDELRKVESQRQNELFSRQRCEFLRQSQKYTKERREAMIQHLKDKAQKGDVQKKLDDEHEYQRQVLQMSQLLLDDKEARDLQARKDYQQNLLDQIAYNKLLKERARQEELDQIRKFELARQEYDEEIKKMMMRPSVTPQMHPFMRQMAKGLKIVEKCPCSRPDYCAPAPNPDPR